jgi:hypothetical protein
MALKIGTRSYSDIAVMRRHTQSDTSVILRIYGPYAEATSGTEVPAFVVVTSRVKAASC